MSEQIGESRTAPHHFRVDMNALDGDLIPTLLTHAADPIGAQLNPPDLGSVIVVRDEDGDTWHAEVVEREGVWLRARIDWASHSMVSFSGIVPPSTIDKDDDNVE